MSRASKCKICRSGKAAEIEFYRLFEGLTYPEIIDLFADEIYNLNTYNLSNHFSWHVSNETMKSLREARQAYLAEQACKQANVQT